MASKRNHIPRTVSDKVFAEYDHGCAICGGANPQLHHIDGDSSNNIEINLIPLCPNCHLIDQHNPTKKIEKEKIELFRKFKDPTILYPQFHPLYSRMEFLFSVNEDSDFKELKEKAKDLIDFVQELEKGIYYANKIGELINPPRKARIYSMDDPMLERRLEAERLEDGNQYRIQLNENKDKIIFLSVELLRYQSWLP